MLTLAYRKEIVLAALFAVAVGAFLSAGFIPVEQSFAYQASNLLNLPANSSRDWMGCAWFVILAAAFHFTFPRPPSGKKASDRLWKTLWPPLVIALLFGALHPNPGLVSLIGLPGATVAAAWVLFFAPVGEEFLFRGWLYSVAHRLWPDRLATATNPLPIAVWVSALGFSLWHLQNWGTEPHVLVALRVAYTLPVGLWLGWLRWRTGMLLPCIIAHCAINLAAALL